MNPKYIVIDLFCGAGGTTTGFDMAMINGSKLAIVAACVNHDPLAIKSHWANHPGVEHFEEDITKLYGHVMHGILFQTNHMQRLVRLVDIYRAAYPLAKVILWASLECTNFSKAKGGQARDADSRTLANHLDRYVAALEPDYIQIENVVEFMSWGPMKNGKPVSKKNGQDWIRWKQHLCTFGFQDEWKELNSANFGAFTSRNRLFGIFARPSMQIVWPESTHAKAPTKNGMFGDLKKWKAVKEVLDFDDEGLSIFGRKKPLVDPSLDRIYAGLVKFVAGGKEAFILKYNSTDKNGKHSPPSVDEPCPTVACQNRLGLVNTSFIAKYYSGKPAGKVIPVTGPSGTITCTDGQALVQVQPYVMNTNVGKSIDEPGPTLVSSRRHPYLVTPKSFISQRNGGDPESRVISIEGPARTLTSTAGNQELVNAVMTNDKHRLIQCDPIIMNPSHGGHSTSVNAPCPVIIARQDKAPLYLIQYNVESDVVIPVYESDSEAMIRIKMFMALYGISDIKMRMLKVPELLKIQGFPHDYVLAGNQSDQKKFIGNSVVPHVVRAWTEAMATGYLKHKNLVAA